MSNDNAFNPFESAQRQFDRIAELMELDQASRRLLRWPMHEHRFILPVRMDDGRMEVFNAFRVQHNDARGPSWGGVRFHPMENFDAVRSFAMWMSWRTALIDIPLGGSAGGVVCDPRMLSLGEQERICRSWVRRTSRTMGPGLDVAAPDMMTSAQHMSWMLDEYEAIAGEHQPGSITGKPVSAGGTRGSQQATGYGVVYAIREALKELGIAPDTTTAAVQGFGRVARHAVELFTQIGGTVTTIATWDPGSDSPLSYRRAEGVDAAQLARISDRFGAIDRSRAEAAGYEVLAGDAWLEQDVDILIPAAFEHQITAANADKLSTRVKIIAEGANDPTSPDAEQAILERGVLIIPDILANAGGVACSYFEQVQSNMNYYWRLSEVLSKLDLLLTDAYIEVSELARNKKLPLRDAAMVIAIARVAEVCRERGWV